MTSRSLSTVPVKPPTRFPSYLLDYVFVHLPLQDLYRCQRVCREWQSAISYFPLLRPILFTAPPLRSPYLPVPVTEIQIHPVFSAIEQDWSIILSATVLSKDNSTRPMLLEDYAVRNTMATYPALKKIIIYVCIEGLHGQSSGGRAGVRGTDKSWTVCAANETGVRVGDVWDTFMNFIAKTKGIAEEDRSLRETFMTGNYHTFTWGMLPADPDSDSMESSHWLLKKTFHGAVYRGWFDRRITAERELQLSLQPPRPRTHTDCSREILQSKPDFCSPNPAVPKRKKRRSWHSMGVDECRRFEGEYDLSF